MVESDKQTSTLRLVEILGSTLDKLEKFIVVTFLASIVVLIFAGVLSRFIFHFSIAFSEELARFIFVWVALLGASSALRTGEHNGIPLIANLFGPRGKRLIEIFVAVGVFVIMSYLVFFTGISTLTSYQSGQISTTTEIPVWSINLGMMLAYAVGVIRCIQGFFEGAFKPEFTPPDELTSWENRDNGITYKS